MVDSPITIDYSWFKLQNPKLLTPLLCFSYIHTVGFIYHLSKFFFFLFFNPKSNRLSSRKYSGDKFQDLLFMGLVVG